MDEFNSLIAIMNRLLGPGGCPWDQEQTMTSTRSSLVEEMYEVLEALDLDDTAQIKEELGDLFFNVIFLCRLAEKFERFTIRDVLQNLNTKLIRRHPHIFGDAKVNNTEELLIQWQEIKKNEKANQPPRSLIQGIPKDLPSLAYAYQLIKRLNKASIAIPIDQIESVTPEQKIGLSLWHLIDEAVQQKVDPEQALRALIAQIKQQVNETAVNPYPNDSQPTE